MVDGQRRVLADYCVLRTKITFVAWNPDNAGIKVRSRTTLVG